MDIALAPSPALLFHVSGRIGGPSGGPSSGRAGRPADGALRPLVPGALRPAVLARYRALDTLRHDFPVVLTPGREFVQTLAGLVDRMLADVAPRGIDGERLRRHALQLETSIRGAVAAGRSDTLAVLWDEAAARIAEREGGPLEQVLQHAGSGLAADGPVLGCDSRMPAQLLRHAWQAAQRAKERQFRADLARLVQKLSDILRAARSHSAAGREPQALRAALGAPHHAQFDFTRLSRFVAKGLPADELPAARRRRLERTLEVLESQRFFAADRDDRDEAVGMTHAFEFTDCHSASLAFQQRLPEAAELIKAIAVAELEARGAYVEAEHDLVFEAFGPHSLGADDLARLPDYLVCIAPDDNDAPANAMLMSLLSSGMPVKVLVQTAELGDDGPIGALPQAFGVRSARLATAAMALGGMFVLQAAASQLFALRARIAAGLAARGPALFSVYTPVDAPTAGAADGVDGADRAAGLPAPALPPYLRAACAAESRAFASFAYDAAAGPNWATRFSLQGNREPEADWPGHTLEYADARQQRCTERVAFTYVDFALTDPRLAGHFAVLPADDAAAADPALLPAAEWLALPAAEAARRAPTVLAVDAEDRLHRVVADSRLMQAAQRCLLLWHRLQEHAGIHDSHADALLAREKAAWAAAAAPTSPASHASPLAATSPAAPAAPAAAGPAEHSRDEAWIETARCPSCNECQRINDRMFAYDERKQAYIKDLAAGSYRQLVEAAESCQVAIIHPGKPRDPNEPGLEALLLRAEPFR